ncbi:MAG: hypothetical protein ACT4ON_12685 [Bacteroidota bacterium]
MKKVIYSPTADEKFRRVPGIWHSDIVHLQHISETKNNYKSTIN